MKWKRLTIEANTPSDMDSINASFSKDVSNEKFTPTVDFMKAVYDKMNKELFFNYLPSASEIRFMVRRLENKSDIGSAPFSKSTKKHEVTPTAIVLNSSCKLTIHGWIEVMLHEMIHVSDYLLNPDSYYDSDYDPHGDWFMKQGKRFKKYGLNVTKYCEVDIDHNDEIGEDECMDNKRNMFLVFRKSKDNLCFRIDAENKDNAMEFLSRQGVKKAFMLSTRNPFSEEVDVWRPGKSISPIDFNDTTITLYGPFRREELLDVSNPVSESEEDELDKYMKVARKIKGVTKVERTGDEVVVWLT